MISLIPIEPGVPDQVFETSFEETKFILRARWNYRMGLWFLDIHDDIDEPIVYGLALVLGAYIGRRVADSRKPPGLFIMSDLSGRSEEAGLDDITDRVGLYYFSSDEFA